MFYHKFNPKPEKAHASPKCALAARKTKSPVTDLFADIEPADLWDAEPDDRRLTGRHPPPRAPRRLDILAGHDDLAPWHDLSEAGT